MNNNNQICPWWMGYALLIPLRKLGQNPHKILGPYVSKGMTVMDYGSAMGYFSLPMAKMTGDSGKVYCVDIQKKMLEKLSKRARNARLDHVIEPLLLGESYNPEMLKNQVDFILLFAVVHEVPDRDQLFRDIYKMTKSGGSVLFAEPAAHVSVQHFKHSLKLAQEAGFGLSENKPMPKGLSALLVK
ncbi:MAG: methyltransferase domain-containing protein [Bacteroidales bacterium]|nr:methyltransferase domain-containing protein [Bacteroidales bacterium]